MARVEREAQMLAAQNHPNIATVYGIEQGALVMEASSIATSSRRTSSLHPRFFERERTLQARTLRQLSLVRRFQTGGNLSRDGHGRRGQDSRLRPGQGWACRQFPSYDSRGCAKSPSLILSVEEHDNLRQL